jgi:hypothetical protein
MADGGMAGFFVICKKQKQQQQQQQTMQTTDNNRQQEIEIGNSNSNRQIGNMQYGAGSWCY